MLVSFNQFQRVMMMDDYDFSIEIEEPMAFGDTLIADEIPEPIDQWAVVDFDQFAPLFTDVD